MATQPLPRILSKEDYAAIRGLSESDLPETFDAWTNERWQEAQQIGRSGHTVEHIDIDPAEFAKHCATKGKRATYQTIKEFAVDKFQRKPEEKGAVARTNIAEKSSNESREILKE